MRSFRTLFALSLLAATCSLASGAPLRAPANDNNALYPRASQLIDSPATRMLGISKGSPATAPADNPPRQQNQSTAGTTQFDHRKRLSDDQTAGGNAHTGSTGDVSSGNINNEAGPDSTIVNDSGGNIPAAGESISGDATGGNGRGEGPGGNATTGDSGDAEGGSINNDAGMVQNLSGSNNAGDGGVSMSGVANGGGSS
ncbi:hypothetical protein K474DRAFT_1655548 [Panus rudis PR-1116 ss-1]|nr:hypothetical protein K474DRAFT_1655548 [Panus rudis PR-1116 ss-1]